MKNTVINTILKSSKNLNVLYIEDDTSVREQTLKMLEVFFNSISVAKNGQEGIDLFEKNSDTYNLIITDLEMPILDGMTMIDKIREINTDIPILIFSAHSNSEYFIRTINSGVDGYILKPYNIDQISNALLKIINKNKLSQEDEDVILLENDFKWDMKNSVLYKDEQSIKLTKNEIKLLELFASAKNTSRTYDEIEAYVFKDTKPDNKRVRNIVSRLKIKLDVDIFESIYAHGYRLICKNA